MKSMGLRVSLLSCAVALALAGCGSKDSSQAVAEQAAAAKAAELEAREQQLAQREAELKQQEEARQAEAAAAEAEAEAAKVAAANAKDAAAREAAAKEAAAKKAAQARHASAASPRPATSVSSSAPSTVAPQAPLEIPAGTQLLVALDSDLSTKTAKVGDAFAARLVSDLTSNGRRVASAGSRVTGTITGVVSGSGAIGAVPMIGLRFDQLDLADGRSVPIRGEIQQTGESEKGRDAAKIIGGAAAGAVIGHQIKDGNKGKVIGGILGGAAGAIVARNTGTEVQLPAGSQLTIALSEGFVVASRLAGGATHASHP